MVKKRIRENLPLQFGCAVYQLAKLHMLKFYWYLMHTLDPEKIQTLESDTDSIYFALAAESLEDIVVATDEGPDPLNRIDHGLAVVD